MTFYACSCSYPFDLTAMNTFEQLTMQMFFGFQSSCTKSREPSPAQYTVLHLLDYLENLISFSFHQLQKKKAIAK